MTSVLNLMVRLSSEVESNIVAVERLKEYGNTPEVILDLFFVPHCKTRIVS